MAWELGALARAAGTKTKAADVRVSAVSTDSRHLDAGSLFVALRGDRFDGHAFVAEAQSRGARGIVVDRASVASLPKLSAPVLVVEDTLRALGDMAKYVRTLHSGKVVAVTGSNGKTTTKELCAAAMAHEGVPHKSAGNLNNLIGLPLSIFSWPSSCRDAVFELGMNVPGEIARLTEICAPQVAVITNVAAAHLGGLGSIENIARAKGELFATSPRDCTVIVNVDDAVLMEHAAPLAQDRPRVTFGRSPRADIRVVAASTLPHGIRVELHIENTNYDVSIPLPGLHNAMNVAAAAGAAIALGLDVKKSLDAMRKVRVPGGRLRVVRDLRLAQGIGIHLIDDTYNANPQSMNAAFETQAALAGDGRRIAVLGDMLELGERASDLHRLVGRDVAAHGANWVLAFGPLSGEVVSGAQEGGANAESFDVLEDVLATLDAGLRDGDWVLVKGSRGMGMERVVRHLEGSGGGS